MNVCDCNVLHPQIIKIVKKNMPPSDQTEELALLFKVFGDSTRVKILSALLISEMCVCDIANLLNMTKSSISHQLRILKHSKLIKYRKSGRSVYYSLADSHVEQIIDCGLSHINE